MEAYGVHRSLGDTRKLEGTWTLGGHMEASLTHGSLWRKWMLVWHMQAWGPHESLGVQCNGGYKEAWGQIEAWGLRGNLRYKSKLVGHTEA